MSYTPHPIIASTWGLLRIKTLEHLGHIFLKSSGLECHPQLGYDKISGQSSRGWNFSSAFYTCSQRFNAVYMFTIVLDPVTYFHCHSHSIVKAKYFLFQIFLIHINFMILQRVDIGYSSLPSHTNFKNLYKNQCNSANIWWNFKFQFLLGLLGHNKLCLIFFNRIHS